MLETPFVIEVEYWNMDPGARFSVMLNVLNEQGVLVFRTSAAAQSGIGDPLPVGLFREVCEVPAHLLNAGIHRIELVVARDHVNVEFRKEEVVVFETIESDTPRPWQGKWHGAVRPALAWSRQQLRNGGPS